MDRTRNIRERRQKILLLSVLSKTPNICNFHWFFSSPYTIFNLFNLSDVFFLNKNLKKSARGMKQKWMRFDVVDDDVSMSLYGCCLLSKYPKRFVFFFAPLQLFLCFITIFHIIRFRSLPFCLCFFHYIFFCIYLILIFVYFQYLVTL